MLRVCFAGITPQNYKDKEKKEPKTTGTKSPEKVLQEELHPGLGGALKTVKRGRVSAGIYCPKSII